MPTVSVIIPTFNRRHLILRALDSVLKQTYRDIDVWIIDDGGSDDTGDVIQTRLAEGSSIPVFYIHTLNRGVAAARNLGVQRSTGRLIALLDSDDLWLPEKLEKQVEYLERHPGIQLVHTGETWIRNGIKVNAPATYKKYGGKVYTRCLGVCMIGPSTVLFTRKMFEKVGGFDEDFPVCEDYDFWLRTTGLYETGLLDGTLTVKYGGHPDQLSTTHVAMDYWRIRSMCRVLIKSKLSPEQSRATVAEIRHKSDIFLKGCLKHGRKERYEEVLKTIRTAIPDYKFE